MFIHVSCTCTSRRLIQVFSFATPVQRKTELKEHTQFSKLDPFVNDGFLIKHLMIIRKNFILFRVIADEAQSSSENRWKHNTLTKNRENCFFYYRGFFPFEILSVQVHDMQEISSSPRQQKNDELTLKEIRNWRYLIYSRRHSLPWTIWTEESEETG